MLTLSRKATRVPPAPPKYPGKPEAMDGSSAVVAMETAGSDAAGAYPITPSTQMGEGWALAVAAGETNVHGRRLLFFEPEGEHAAAAVTAGMSLTGLRATNFSSGQGIAYMHESLYAAVGKRLTYVLNVAARAMTKHALNVHAGHDDYHCVDDTGFFQLFAKDVQESADFTLIAHRIAELALTPGINAQDGFLTSHVIESILLPERELVKEYLGDPADLIESPTPAQRLVFGRTRRRIPELFDVDYPALLGAVQNQDAYAQGVAAQRPYYFDHVAALTDRALDEFALLTGRRYARAAGYRLDDAEYVLAGQGSVVANAEAVVDYLRDQRGIKVGVLNLTMFRPFPADLVTQLLCGKRAVTVLERVDQPLAVDPPLLRELRAAMGKAVENGRAAARPDVPHERGSARLVWGSPREHGVSDANGNGDGNGNGAMLLPFEGVASLAADDVPDFYSAGFGFGSRDLQPGDIVAAVENMLPGRAQRRQFYLGVDFLRKDTRLPKLQLWQQQLREAYPHLDTLALESAGDLDLTPPGATALRIHSVGGWGAITMGKNLVMTAFELAGTTVKANPKYGSEKKGQPTTFYATLAHEPLRLNCELKHVDAVLSPDPNVFRHSDPLAGLKAGGVFVIQSELDPDALWRSLPASAQRAARERNIRILALDGFRIAADEARDAELRYRMQGAAFMGAFFAASPFMQREGLDRERLFAGIEAQLERKFAKLGRGVVEDNLRVIRRGFDEVRDVPHGDVGSGEAGTALGGIPALLDVPGAAPGVGNPGRFWEQVCSLCTLGQDGIADPFAAVGAMPASSSAIRDMTDIRLEVPDFIAAKCTGCAQCWMQCPDAAIPGLVTPVEDLIEAALHRAAATRPVDRLRQVARPLAKECRKLLDGVPFTSFEQTLSAAYANLVARLGWEPERRAALDADFAAVYPILADMPLARTTPFYAAPESKEKGSGGLLSITINPEACKGCNVCVDVCPENALVTVRQDDEIVERLRRNWSFWETLPDTPDRFVNVSNLDEGIGVLSSLLLRKHNYRSMAGGDGACMGCGEKTAVHLVVSTIEAAMQPRVRRLVAKVDALIAALDRQARELIAADADLDAVAHADRERVTLPIGAAQHERLGLLQETLVTLRDLRWRYVEGPAGRGRVSLGITNSTGCSSVWGSTYPYNPYPFPWVNHLFQDAPSIAIGVFEGHMRKMADAFVAIRRAGLLERGEYDAARDEAFFVAFDWRQFDDEEFKLCPPILVIGGDGAMLDIGFQNLSRLLASGKPIRVMVLDTQVYSNTGGQACTSGFTGQIADMSAYGAAEHGKEEVRKELALIALAHRGAFVLQSSQASPSHLIAGVIRGLNARRPAVFNIYTPCPVEHGLPDEWAPHAAKLALESRAFPYLVYDPDAGESYAECLSLDGNPDVESRWPGYTLSYVDDEGNQAALELPLTIADWAATESRFRKHFTPLPPGRDSDDLLNFAEFMALPRDERDGKTPFVYTIDGDRRLSRLAVSAEIVRLAEDRLLFWTQLRELAGIRVSEPVRDAVAHELEAEYERRAAALRAEYETRIAELEISLPRTVARRMAQGLITAAAGAQSVSELIERAIATPGLEPIPNFDAVAAAPPAAAPEAVADRSAAAAAEPGAGSAAETSGGAATPAAGAGTARAADDDDLVLEPTIETARCTSCNECTAINSRMFAYDANKQAYIKDARAGTFAQLVLAAERCPALLIHPGTPLNPKEKDLEKWVERAKPFN